MRPEILSAKELFDLLGTSPASVRNALAPNRDGDFHSAFLQTCLAARMAA
jgi:hypothetical protein